jgi:hypothetical protein
MTSLTDSIRENGLDTEDILTAYEEYVDALDELVEAQIDRLRISQEWDDYYSDGLMDGAIDGKNDRERMASAVTQNPNLRFRVVKADEINMVAKANVEKKKMGWWLIGRLIEVQKVFHTIQDMTTRLDEIMDEDTNGEY